MAVCRHSNAADADALPISAILAKRFIYWDVIQVAQLSQRDRAAVWVSCGANINVVFRIQRTLL